MQPLGKITQITKDGNLVVRGKEIPSIYSLVGTAKAKIGKIHDVIGPSSNPYIIIKPNKKLDKKELLAIKGEVVYDYKSKVR